ncbi:MAG TPA: hypothetical protein VN085_01275 [Vicinamibacterales bacterium]|nr:hypothetical protein [Vicinamibacterales bacterium]
MISRAGRTGEKSERESLTAGREPIAVGGGVVLAASYEARAFVPDEFRRLAEKDL